MSTPTGSAGCLDEAHLVSFLLGQLRGEALASADAHIDSCSACQARLLELARGRDSARVPAPSAAVLRRGDPVGRYLVVDAVGSGAMGQVYLAYDPELNRRLAVKVLRQTGETRGERSRRLMREAQLLAGVSHPNTVSVFDVGTTASGEVFLAMEHVDGGTLLDWKNAAPRTVREVLGVLVDAGRGLAAAHAMGVVHSDFKPENVLVGSDGRARVTDFGLARLGDETDGLPQGTPAYAAPEVLAGRAPDFRADQYSFCVVVRELLSGAKLPEPLARGLSADPAERFPSLDALLAALDTGAAAGRRRRRLASAVGVLAAASLAALAVTRVLERGQLCRGADALIATAWSPDRRQAMHAAFAATGLPYAGDVEATTTRALNARAREWAAMHTAACEATRVDGVQSEEALDLRMTCLSQRLQELKATSELLVRADAKVVELSVEVVSQLSPLSTCADLEALRAPLRPPKDAAAKAAIEMVRGQLAEARALEQVGAYDAGFVRAASALEGSRAVGWLPVEAEALEGLGNLQLLADARPAAERTLEDAFYAAEASRHDALAARSAILLGIAIGEDPARVGDGRRWVRIARAVHQRGPADPVNAGLLELAEADLDASDAHYAEAIEGYRRALAIEEKSRGPDARAVARLYGRLGNSLFDQGKLDEALAEYRRALDIVEHTAGPAHPLAADGYNNMSTVSARLGNYADALLQSMRARGIWEATLGVESASVAIARLNGGAALQGLGRFDDALAEYRAALAIFEKAKGPEDWDVANTHYCMGTLLGTQRQLDRALAEHRGALAIWEKTLGPDAPLVAMTLTAISDTLMRQGKPKEALGGLQRALATRTAVLGADHPETAVTLAVLGQVNLALNAHAEAAGQLKAAIAVLEAKAPNPEQLGEFRFALARALWETRGERGAAVELARRARTDVASVARLKGELGELDAWLAAHR